jgi:anti-anti-sigma factor
MELLSVSIDPAERVIRVRGELDCATGPGVEEVLLRRLREWGTVVTDLAGVSFVDCAGLGTLVAVQQWALRQHLRLVLTRPAPAVRRLLDVVGEPVLDLSPDLASVSRAADVSRDH